MNTYLLAISIGPVQEFIAAGRRTADLYAGSQLITEIVQAAAAALDDMEPGCLIFPASAETVAANKILAEVTADPAAAAKAAEDAAWKHLRAAWSDALTTSRLTADQRAAINEGLAGQQINSFLEWYAAWQPCTGSYSKDRRDVERLLAGRKALREFRQPPKQNVWKSPLDPSRDTVILGEGHSVPVCLSGVPLRLKGSEWLDAVSLLKRIRGSKSGAPSTADIAALTFLAEDPEVAALVGSNPKGVIYQGRREELREEGELAPAEFENIQRAMRGKEPSPYFAILQADGDRIGERLSGMQSAREHREFSALLQAFAARAKEVVQRHTGHLVYAGGDDVLAILPLHTSLRCAADLAKAFRSTGPTLSVGVAIVHYHEPLHAGLKSARAAERAAKDAGGNRLYVEIVTRGGEARHASLEWGAVPGLNLWRQWVQAFQDGQAAGFPYEIERLAREFQGVDLARDEAEQASPGPSGAADSARGSGLRGSLLRAEVLRIFARKKAGRSGGETVNIESLLEGVDDHAALHRLAQQLIVYRWLASQSKAWEWEEGR